MFANTFSTIFLVVIVASVVVAAAESSDPFLIHFTLNLGKKQKGDVVMEVYPEWAPLGAARIRELIEGHVFDSARFFRVVPGFMVQWGIPAKPEMAAIWKSKSMQDEPVLKSNTRGYVSFAAAGPHSRTSQMFINFADNSNLDSMGFAPFARVIKGMDVVDRIYSGYGEKPDQGAIQGRGNKYLKKEFPRLSYIEHAHILSDDERPKEKEEELNTTETVTQAEL